MQISDDSFHSLERFGMARAQGKQIYLKLTTKEGKLHLEAYTKAEMGVKDRVMNLLHMRGFNLQKITDALASESFGKALENRKLGPYQHGALRSAFLALDQDVTSYNRKKFSKGSRDFIKTSFISQFATCAAESPVPTRSLQRSLPLDTSQMISIEELKEKKSEIARAAFQQVERRLLHDIDTARASIDMDANLVFSTSNHWFHAYNALLLEHMPDYENANRELINKAQLRQARRIAQAMTEQWDGPPPYLLAFVCKKQGLEPPSRAAIAKEKVRIFDALMKDQAFLALEPKQAKEQLSWKKYEAAFLAAGISADVIPFYCHVFNSLTSSYRSLYETAKQKVAQAQHHPKIETLAPLAKQAIQTEIEGLILSKTYAAFEKYAERYIALLSSRGRPSLSLYLDAPLRFARNVETLLATRQTMKEVAPTVAYYQKWQRFLTNEIQQEASDPHEALGRGVCYALSLRWAIDALKSAAGIPSSQIGSKDRFYQAQYAMDPNGTTVHLTDTEKAYGIKSKKTFEREETISGKKEVIKVFRNLVEDSDFQSHYKGVAQVSFNWRDKDSSPHGHAITIVMQQNPQKPQESLFEFRDPNYGTFVFPVEGNGIADMQRAQELCLIALGDLLYRLYNKEFWNLKFTSFML